MYYPALDVTSGTGTATTNRLGRQGREWYQHPDAWTASVRMNRYQGAHNLKWGGEIREYFGEAARFEPINLVFNSTVTANSSDSPDVVATGNQWATFMLGALDGQTSARLVPLQTTNLRGYAAYVQDDFRVNDRLTLNLGLRWEYEPGPTDPENRLSQRIDLTSPIPEMQATPPPMNAQALALMASKGYGYTYNGAWVFTSEDDPHAWHSTWKNFMPRVGANYQLGEDAVVRLAYARFQMPISNVRDTLGDFVNQYAGFAQTTNTLGLATGRPQQLLANPYPANNPVTEPYGQAYGRYTNLGGAVSLDEYELRPQINDRFNISAQKRIWGGAIVDASYFFNRGTRVPYSMDVNMMDPAFRYEYKTLLNTQVPNPFRNYLTPDKFPGALRNNATVTLGSLLKPYPQYTALTQTNTNGKELRTHTAEIRAQRPFAQGVSFMAAYAWNHERIQQWFDDRATYQTLQTDGEEGWTWMPVVNSPTHRFTAAATIQIPVGRDRRFGATMPLALDLLLGGWQVHGLGALLLGAPVAVRDELRRVGQPEARQPDARPVVRHDEVRRAERHEHAAHEPVVLRGAQRAGGAVRRHDADQGRDVRPVQARSPGRGLQRAEHDRVGQPGRDHLVVELRQGDAQAHRRARPRDPARPALRVLAWSLRPRAGRRAVASGRGAHQGSLSSARVPGRPRWPPGLLSTVSTPRGRRRL